MSEHKDKGIDLVNARRLLRECAVALQASEPLLVPLSNADLIKRAHLESLKT